MMILFLFNGFTLENPTILKSTLTELTDGQ